MKAALIFIAVVIVVALVGFAAHDVVSLRMGISTAAWRAPEQSWNALVDTVTLGIQYRGWSVLVIVCLVALCIVWNPVLKRR